MMSTPARAPNIVLIVADYMGYKDIEPYGAEDIRTPALSQLARDGARFTNFYSAAPMCAPARAALLSGQYPERVGVARNPVGTEGLAKGHDTIALKLAEAGYDTALFGKWHLGAEANSSPRAQGFQEFLGFYPWTISYYSHQSVTGEPGL